MGARGEIMRIMLYVGGEGGVWGGVNLARPSCSPHSVPGPHDVHSPPRLIRPHGFVNHCWYTYMSATASWPLTTRPPPSHSTHNFFPPNAILHLQPHSPLLLLPFYSYLTVTSSHTQTIPPAPPTLPLPLTPSSPNSFHFYCS